MEKTGRFEICEIVRGRTEDYREGTLHCDACHKAILPLQTVYQVAKVIREGRSMPHVEFVYNFCSRGCRRSAGLFN